MLTVSEDFLISGRNPYTDLDYETDIQIAGEKYDLLKRMPENRYLEKTILQANLITDPFVVNVFEFVVNVFEFVVNVFETVEIQIHL